MRINKGRFQKREQDLTRINHMIRVPRVRLISSTGEPVGIVPIGQALEQAEQEGYDLVEIAQNAEPPVCRIMDYGKFKYEKAQKIKDAKKKQHVMHLKEIKLHPKTDGHDFEFKMNHARKFLLRGDRVKVTLVFRGREITHIDHGKKILLKAEEYLSDIAQTELHDKREGRSIVSVFIPDKIKINQYKKKKAQQAEKSDEKE